MTTFFGRSIPDIPIAEFFLMPEEVHEDIRRWQERNPERLRQWLGEEPPFWIACAQGRFLLWPVLPSGARIVV